MMIKKKSKSKGIIRAAKIDGINYIIGLSRLPVPLAVIEELWRIWKEGSPPHFVDWKLEEWPRLYHKELGECLKLPYKGEEYFLPQILIFDNTRKELDLSKILFCPTKTFFKLPDDIRALTEDSFEKLLIYLRKNRIYANEQNLRLIKIIKVHEKVILKVNPVEYKYYVHTNLVLDVKSKGKDQTLREYVHSSEGKLEDLDKSKLADQLGINILLFTADGSLIMQKRSNKVAFRTGELCPAASGWVSEADVPTRITLEEMSKLREACEEIGIIKTDVPIDHFFFLGLARELIRGGTVDMFFFGKTILSEKEILVKWADARDKWESKDLIFFNFGQTIHKKPSNDMEKHKFLLKIDEFINDYSDQASIPLLTSVALFVKFQMGW